MMEKWISSGDSFHVGVLMERSRSYTNLRDMSVRCEMCGLTQITGCLYQTVLYKIKSESKQGTCTLCHVL